MGIPFGVGAWGPWFKTIASKALSFAIRLVYVSQEVNEVLNTATPETRVSQEVSEVLDTATPVTYVSQEVGEVLDTATPIVYVSQLVVEVLIPNIEAPMLPIYPENIPGLAYNVKWTPNFFNMPTQTASAGADIDLAWASTPLHDFELIYEFLRDGLGHNEFKKMMGFMLRLGGTSGRFLFRNPDDYQTVAEYVATTDGVNTRFAPIQRTFGSGDDVGVEPVGYVDETAPVKLYLDGVEQSSVTWSLDQTTPGEIGVIFSSVPTTGQVITMDFNYFYYCKFSENAASFEKFLNQVWNFNSVKIHSCRAGA